MKMGGPAQRQLHHANGLHWMLGLLLCLATLANANPQKVSFPGPKSESKSPDGHYGVRNFDYENREPAHTLTLIDTKTGSEFKIYSYGRHVDVLWSPNSSAFVVNDYEGSDASHPVLFVAPWKDQPIDLREKLIEFLRVHGETKSATYNHHTYFSATRWLSNNEILCRIDGYGQVNPSGFTSDYVYKFDEGFRAYSKKVGSAGE
jgi:hypothetical protein